MKLTCTRKYSFRYYHYALRHLSWENLRVQNSRIRTQPQKLFIMFDQLGASILITVAKLISAYDDIRMYLSESANNCFAKRSVLDLSSSLSNQLAQLIQYNSVLLHLANSLLFLTVSMSTPGFKKVKSQFSSVSNKVEIN